MALCGCDKLFGIGMLPDAPPDVAYMDAVGRPCTPGVLPMFVGAVHDLGLACSGYSTDQAATTAIAVCAGGVSRGPANSKALTIQTFSPSGTFTAAVFRPDGHAMWTLGSDNSLYHFMQNPSVPDNWAAGAAVTFNNTTVIAGDQFGAASGPLGQGGAHALVLYRNHTFAEYRGNGAFMSAFGPVLTAAALANITPLGAASLTEDGIRIVFSGQQGTSDPNVYYLERSDVMTPFAGTPMPIYAAPGTEATPYLTVTCQTLYFSENNEVFYVDPR